MVAGCIVLLFIVFGIFVQLTPPKEVAPKASIIPENIPLNKNGVPDFMDPTLTANKEPVGAEDAMLKEALDEAAEALKVAAASEGNGEETIEL